MKINKVENKYSHVIKKDDLIELEKILKEFSFTDFAYMVELADGAICKYKSVDELFELNNIEKKRILKLEIECYASALDARNCHICIFRNRRFVGKPVEYQYSFPTEKDNVYFFGSFNVRDEIVKEWEKKDPKIFDEIINNDEESDK